VRKIPRTSNISAVTGATKPLNRDVRARHVTCSFPGETNVFRSFTLTIVLTLAAVPAARMICQAACDPQVAAASGCHHSPRARATIVAGIDNCSSQPLTAVILLRGDERRGGASTDEGHAVFSATGYVAAGLVSHRIPSFRRAGPPVQRRPRTTILRI
jgi:hypothetical protein